MASAAQRGTTIRAAAIHRRCAHLLLSGSERWDETSLPLTDDMESALSAWARATLWNGCAMHVERVHNKESVGSVGVDRKDVQELLPSAVTHVPVAANGRTCDRRRARAPVSRALPDAAQYHLLLVDDTEPTEQQNSTWWSFRRPKGYRRVDPMKGSTDEPVIC